MDGQHYRTYMVFPHLIAKLHVAIAGEVLKVSKIADAQHLPNFFFQRKLFQGLFDPAASFLIQFHGSSRGVTIGWPARRKQQKYAEEYSKKLLHDRKQYQNPCTKWRMRQKRCE